MNIIILKKKSILLKDVIKTGVRKYSAINDFGGWGIRWGFDGVNAYIQLGVNTGVLFLLKNGQKILISSNKPNELNAAVERILNQEK